jgi:hypothetical protein
MLVGSAKLDFAAGFTSGESSGARQAARDADMRRMAGRTRNIKGDYQRT